MCVCVVCVCALTSSRALILPRNISNRPEHSHLPLCCPSTPVLFFLPLFNHLTASSLTPASVCALSIFPLIYFPSPPCSPKRVVCCIFPFPHLLILSFSPPVLHASPCSLPPLPSQTHKPLQRHTLTTCIYNNLNY